MKKAKRTHAPKARRRAVVSRPAASSARAAKGARAIVQPEHAAFPVVGIGASAGGLEAFFELFEHIPPDTGMAFVLVQHLAPDHLSLLAELIKKKTRMKVVEARDGMRVVPNGVYIIPPNRAMEIFHGVLHVRPLPEGRATNRLVDTFFSSLAKDHGALAVGIVLSGTGSDGAQGLREIKGEGGISLVQDPKTAKFDGMPKMAIAYDHPDLVMPVDGLVRELLKIAANPYAASLPAEPVPSAEDELVFSKLFLILREQTGTDFSVYKLATMMRRVNRRMLLQKIDSRKKYVAFLRSNPAEVRALFNDLLINVTNFFREPTAFESIRDVILPELVRNRPEGEPIRIWVPGCATGEEVYSLTIVLLEYFEASGRSFPIQIYGTDISEQAIKKARLGIYPEAIEKFVSPERLKRYFVKDRGNYRISREVRDRCVFSIQDVTADPPIHRLDILSCRNLMIYLRAEAQTKLVDTFFYALNPRGYLLLGASENIGAAASYFATADKKSKIFVKRANAVRPKKYPASPLPKNGRAASDKSAKAENREETDPVQEAEAFVARMYSPAWILLNQDLEIVQIRGSMERYLAPTSGQPSWSLERLLRKDLVAEIAILIQRAGRGKRPASKAGIRYKFGSSARSVNVEVTLISGGPNAKHYLVAFAEARPPEPAKGKGRAKISAGEMGENRRLKRDLRETQRSLRELLSEQNVASEHFQSANEEVRSANEELQSANEELETAKEELQSTNEELTTLNDELAVRNAELANASNDLANILNNANIPLVMLGPDLEIRRFTPVAGKLLNLMTRDIGRKLTDINIGIEIKDLESRVHEVVQSMTTFEFDAPTRGGRMFSVRIRPYKTVDNKIDGAVVMFIDIADAKESEKSARVAEAYANAIVELIHVPFLVLNHAFRVEKASAAFCERYGVNAEEIVGLPIHEVGDGKWNVPDLRKFEAEVLRGRAVVKNFEVKLDLGGGQKSVLLSAQRIHWAGQENFYILMSMRDAEVTEGDPT